jgi:hypothetical protein
MAETKKIDLSGLTKKEVKDQLRTALWRLGLANRQMGKQGATIYQLRTENAALREGLTFNPGDRARLLDQLHAAEAENQRLKEKLAAKDQGQ